MSAPKPPGDRPPRRRGGHPPVEHQFKPGQSGNPGGRPKKKRTLRDHVFDLLDEEVGKAEESPTVGRLFLKNLLGRLAQSPKDAMPFLSWLDGAQPPAAVAEAEAVLEDPEADLDIIAAALERVARRTAAKPRRARKSEPEA